MKIINLSNNQLKSIETEVFKELPELEVLEFNENPIEKVNGQAKNDATYRDLIFNANSSLNKVNNEQRK